MIRHEFKAGKHLVTPMTEKAARFLNTFLYTVVVMDDQMWRSCQLEMPAHRVFIMGENH